MTYIKVFPISFIINGSHLFVLICKEWPYNRLLVLWRALQSLNNRVTAWEDRWGLVLFGRTRALSFYAFISRHSCNLSCNGSTYPSLNMSVCTEAFLDGKHGFPFNSLTCWIPVTRTGRLVTMDYTYFPKLLLVIFCISLLLIFFYWRYKCVSAKLNSRYIYNTT